MSADLRSRASAASATQVSGDDRDHHSQSKNSPADDSKENAPKHDLWTLLPDWASTNLKNPRSLKVLFRCWLAVWAGYILLLCNSSLEVMGNAAFFCVLGAFMMPPNLPIQLFLFMMATIVTGICIGWAIGAAGMKAALSARSQVLLAAALKKTETSELGSTNPDAVFENAIFEGVFLDTRSSVVMGVFLGVGAFFFALVRAYRPQLTLMSVFGTISIDIFCTYGPLFPIPEYTFSEQLLIPLSMYIAIAIFLIIFLFPETMSHAYLEVVSKILGIVQTILTMHGQVLDTQGEEFLNGCPQLQKLQGLRQAMIGLYSSLGPRFGLINSEFSWGRWHGDDIQGLGQPLIGVITRINALMSFVRHINRRQSAFRNYSTDETTTTGSEDGKSENTAVSGDTYLIRQLYTRNRAAEQEKNLRLLDILPNISSATAELRAACIGGVAGVKSMLDFINTTRYKRDPGGKQLSEHEKALDECAETLRVALNDFKNNKRLQLLAPYRLALEERQKEPKKFVPMSGLFVSFVFGSTLVEVGDVVMTLIEYVQEKVAKRRRNRLWAPKGLRAIGNMLLFSHNSSAAEALGEEEQSDDLPGEMNEEKPFVHDPDSRPPTNALQRSMNMVHNFYAWTKTAEFLFVFRYTLVTVLLWLPCVFPTSANFYYAQKGLWALIMAQTTMNIYAGDQVFNYVVRLLGTFIGAVIGLLAWYIGNAKSNGSPYGSAAAMAVFFVPMMFTRLYAPPKYLPGVILMNVTVALVVGYSWIDGHLVVFDPPGIGWDVAWRRFVLVIIGSFASFIVMMLPPKSGRKAVRLRNATTINNIGQIYTFLMSIWISTEKIPHDKAHEKQAVTQFKEPLRRRIVAVITQIQSVLTQADMAQWEGNLRGHWPYEDYVKLAQIQLEMAACLAQLAGALWKLDDDWRISYLHDTKVVNPNFIQDVLTTFSLVSQSLRTGEPMHTVLPQNLLDRLVYHYTTVAYAAEGRGGSDTKGPKRSLGSAEDYESLEFMYYSAAIVAAFQVFDCLDELHSITRRLCGEVPFKGFYDWRHTHQQVHHTFREQV